MNGTHAILLPSRRRLAVLALAVIGLAFGAPSAFGSVDFTGKTLPDNVDKRRIEIDGLGTRLFTAAPRGKRRSREAAVFLHGFPGSSLDYVHLLAATGKFGRAVAFDFPGFGRADKPLGVPYTFDFEVRFLKKALRRLGIRRVHLVGHDFGGFYGMEWASAHPRRLRSATLIDSGVLPPDYPGHFFAYISALPGIGETYNRTQRYPTFRAGFSPPAHPPLPESFIRRMYEEYDDPGTRYATPRLYRSFADYRERSQRWIKALRPLDRKALVVWGANDPYIPARVARYQREAFPRANVNVLAEIGHFPFVEAAKQTRKLVRRFLERRLSANPHGSVAPQRFRRGS